jgi:hypothetical protein
VGSIVAAAIAGAFIFAGIGWAIGAPKNRHIEGAVLGLFLGVIGLVVVAVMSPDTRGQVPSPAAPPAWYADPWQPGWLRWWDGYTWTTATHATEAAGFYAPAEPTGDSIPAP